MIKEWILEVSKPAVDLFHLSNRIHFDSFGLIEAELSSCIVNSHSSLLSSHHSHHLFQSNSTLHPMRECVKWRDSRQSHTNSSRDLRKLRAAPRNSNHFPALSIPRSALINEIKGLQKNSENAQQRKWHFQVQVLLLATN